MRNKALFVALLTVLLTWFSGPVDSAMAAAPPQIFNIVLPEDFDPVGFNLFGANDENQDLPVVIDETASSPFLNLTTAIDNDTIFGTAVDSTGNNLIVVYGEDEEPSGWTIYFALVDATGSFLPGWPVAENTDSNLVKILADTAGGFWVLYDAGGGVNLTHYDSSGTESLGYSHFLGSQTVDMIPDGAGGVFVLFSMGPIESGGFPSHGSVQHELPNGGGFDFAWTTGGGFTFEVSDENTTEKTGATLMSDGSGGGIVLWNEPDGIYGQRFDSNGDIVPGWATRGNLLYSSVNVHTADYVRGTLSGVGNYYATFRENGVVTTISFDGTGNSLWACGAQTLIDTSGYMVIPSEDVTNPGVYVIFDDGSVYAQLFAESTGNSVWGIGGEEIAAGSDFDFVFPNQSFFENKSSGVVSNAALTGFEIGYSNSNSGNQEPTLATITPTSFGAGGGGDCTVGAAPDPIADLVATAGVSEVELMWSAPADGGDPITDYVVQFGETSGFPVNAAVFPDGMGTATNATVTGLTNGTEYSFIVSAVNGIGTAADSNIATATPQALAGGGRGRFSPIDGPQFFLGQLKDVGSVASNGSSTGLNSEEGLRGAAETASPSRLAVNPADEGFDDGFPGLRGVDGSFSDNSLFPTFLGGGNRSQILSLLDLIVALRKTFAWTNPDHYELTDEYVALQRSIQQLFRTRAFHQLVGVEYLERAAGDRYDFSYRFPIDNPVENIAFLMRSVLLTFGKACYDADVLEYAEAADRADNPFWFERYVQIMKPWMDEVLRSRSYVLWRTTDDIDLLDAIYLFLYGFCLDTDI